MKTLLAKPKASTRSDKRYPMNDNPTFEQTWRWYGPSDPVTLREVRQTGATGVVTALHHIPVGEVWPVDEILQHQQTIERAGLHWSVVESVNVHEHIRTAAPDREQYLENYRQTLKNLSFCGLRTVCYNFMPVLDWTRTHLAYAVSDGSLALRCDVRALAAVDLFILQRSGAKADYSAEQQQRALTYLNHLSPLERETLRQTVMAGLPGSDTAYSLEELQKRLTLYHGTDAPQLRRNLHAFLQAVVPTAEEQNVKLCIHPDDPPFPVIGLPRIVSTESDLLEVIQAFPSPNNGITFCSGSLGARADNDLPGIVQRLGQHIHFVHLRNVQRESNGSFFEADHLTGSVDMFAIIKGLIEEQKRRQENKQGDLRIPFRPDHGHQTLFDAHRTFPPGYSAVGRLRGLAELRGLELGIRRMMKTTLR